MLWEFSALLPKRGKKHARTDVINRVAFLCISKEIPGPGYDAQEDNVSINGQLTAPLDILVYAPHGRELEGENPLRKNHLLRDYTTGGNR